MVKISWEEYQRIRDLKELDIEVCEFGCVNILNLGWPAFKQVGCQKHQRKHVLCPQLCYKAAKNILDCELYQLSRKKQLKKPVKPNLTYDKCACYLCGKELKGAGKTGKIKNRNNPGFWGLKVAYKILCLECVGRKFYGRMRAGKRKTWRKYVRRGYV